MDENQPNTTEFEARYRNFIQRIVVASSFIVCISSIIVGMLAINYLVISTTRLGTGLVFLMSFVSFFVARKGKVELAAGILIIGSHITVCLTCIIPLDIGPVVFFCFIFFIAAAAFLISHRSATVLLALSLVTIFVSQISIVIDGSISEERIVLIVSGTLGIILTSLVILVFSRQLALNLAAHRRRLIHNERLF